MNEERNAPAKEVLNFIAGLRAKTRGMTLATKLPVRPADLARRALPSEHPIDLFVASAAKINTRAYVTDAAHLPDVLLDVLKQNALKSLLLAPLDADLLTDEQAADLRKRLSEHGIEICDAQDDETLFRVDAALTGVEAAVAEYGSIACESGAGQARGASLIPPTHIALVPASRIVPDLCDLFDDARAGTVPAGISIITGPSKTADIEGVLVNGVHGPKTVHAICVRDA